MDPQWSGLMLRLLSRCGQTLERDQLLQGP